MPSIYAPDWTVAERERWKADYLADRPVLLPTAEHDQGECDHCDLLRSLMAEAEADTPTSRNARP